MNRDFFRQIGLLSLVLLWLGSTNHCVFDVLFSVHDVHAENTTAAYTTPPAANDAPCHDSGENDHPCGAPCANAGPVELKIAQQNLIHTFAPPLAAPNFLAEILALVRCLEHAPKTKCTVFNLEHERLIASLLLVTLRVPNAPPTI